jgi:uncharacterized protein YidB (DUF937 family)
VIGMAGLDDLLGSLTKQGGGSGGGGLNDLLGGLLGGSGGGSQGGLSKMVQGAQTSGLSAQADSWVGTGANAPVSAQEVRGVVGDDTVTELARQAGISDDQAADVLAQVVPQVVNGLTPDGKLPADDDLDQLVAKFGG